MILAQCQYGPIVAAQVFANTTQGEVLIDYFMARSSDTVAQTLSVWIVPNGGAMDNSNLRTVATVSAGQPYILTEIIGDALTAGDSIWLLASAGTLSVKISGRQR